MTRILLITAIAFAVSALLTSILASPVKSYENYNDALALIEKKYDKIKAYYSKKDAKYYYEFISIVDFPFFCAKKNTLEGFLTNDSEVVYLRDNTVAIRKNRDITGALHIQLTVLSYFKPTKGKNPLTKTYTMFYLKQNQDETWMEEKTPKIATIFLFNAETVEYRCK